MITRLHLATVCRMAFGLTALLACGGLVACAEEPDPRLSAAVEVDSAGSAEVQERARDPRFDAFREVCRRERAAIEKLGAFRRSIGDRPMTEAEAATYGQLMDAVKPLAEEVSTWFERGDFDETDRDALRRIHDADTPGESATGGSDPAGEPRQ